MTEIIDIPDSNAKQSVDLALEHLRERRDEMALNCAHAAIALTPSDAFARLLLGVALARLGRQETAIAELQSAATLAPGDAQIRYNLAVSLQAHGQEDLAMYEYHACLERDPDFANALWNYGEMLRLREYFDKALECFDRLARLEGTLRNKALHRMAVCCSYLALDERAQALFEQQIAEDDDPATHWEYAHFLLGRGRFDEAWPHYAKRFDAGEKIDLKDIDFPCEVWRGQYRAGATLIVSGEQGGGDEILFSAFLPSLLERACEAGMQVVVACRPALVKLFRVSFPTARVISCTPDELSSMTGIAQQSSCVWRIPMGNLPLWCAKPIPTRYLRPAPEDQAAARVVVGAINSDSKCKRIGIVWSSNQVSTALNRRARSVPSELLNIYLKDVEGVHFYALMPSEHRAALAGVPDLPMTDLSFFVEDFSQTAALMQCMDEIISVCTSSANLAGALGLKVHVLLQKYADWRWYQDTAWYPNVVTFRQRKRLDWSDCLKELAGQSSAEGGTSESIEVS